MQRPQLEPTIRDAAGITGTTEIVGIGSQAVLGQFPSAPPELLVSISGECLELAPARHKRLAAV